MTALMLAMILGATSPAPLMPALAPSAPASIDWSLSGRITMDDEGQLGMGLTWTPDVQMPLGIVLEVQRIEWDETAIVHNILVSKSGRSTTWDWPTTATQDDTRVRLGLEWRFR